MTTHIYTRVSTKAQDQRSQMADLRRYAGDRQDVQWYTDQASGKSMDRPGWAVLMARVQRGDSILIWRMDRLGRTCRGLSALFADLAERGVNLISLKDSLDLSTPSGRLTAHILSSVAEFELELRTERQRAGIEAFKATGRKWPGGRPKGSRSTPPEKIAAVHELRAAGKSISHIARVTSLSRPTVYSILDA